jgi:S1-C subfamily serine protease
MFVMAFVFQGMDDGPTYQPKPGASERRPPADSRSSVRRPPPGSPSDVLPPISRNDPTFKLGPSKKGNSTGTAFSVGDGVWMTARHVLDGCARFGIVVGDRRVEKGFDVVLNPYHDLAMFRTRRRAPALGFESAALSRGQNAFHFGYPQGKPADVHSTLLGRMKIKPSGANRHREPVIAWAEVRRVPNFSGSLGGISGGPVVDAEGDVIGVSVVEAPRRGRIFTAAPAGLRHMLKIAGATARDTSDGTVNSGVDPRGFQRVGSALRSGLTVAKVICWVD